MRLIDVEQEAINIINKVKEARIDTSAGIEKLKIIFACEMAIKALEKQIPKKAKITLSGTTGWNTVCHCPSCNGFLAGTDKFCHKCGQALDWGGKKKCQDLNCSTN